MIRYLIYVIFLLLSIAKSFAQDEIVLKKTGEPLDYELKILEIKNDSIYFKAFRKVKKLALSEVESYTRDYRTALQVQSKSLQNGGIIFVNDSTKTNPFHEVEPTSVITAGFLQGGGGILGFDAEILVSRNISVQAGASIFGLGAGINMHLKPSLRSSFLCLGYWHQGIGNGYVQSLIGPTFVYRAKRLFTAQLGFGYKVGEGPAIEEYKRLLKVDEAPSAIMIYSIGMYFPIN